MQLEIYFWLINIWSSILLISEAIYFQKFRRFLSYQVNFNPIQNTCLAVISLATCNIIALRGKRKNSVRALVTVKQVNEKANTSENLRASNSERTRVDVSFKRHDPKYGDFTREHLLLLLQGKPLKANRGTRGSPFTPTFLFLFLFFFFFVFSKMTSKKKSTLLRMWQGDQRVKAAIPIIPFILHENPPYPIPRWHGFLF